MELQECPAEDDLEGQSPLQTGRQGLQSAETLQGRRADLPRQQQPGETGQAPGGQAGGGNHYTSEGNTAGFIFGDKINSF